jgi:hypothetical protein
MSDCPPTREEIREMLSDAAKRLREHHGAIASRIDCGCGDLAAQLDGLSESIVGLLEDRDRLDALEREVNSGVRGNGVAVFPYTRLNGVRHISLVELGDEDGSDLGDEFAIGLTLREAVDAARHQPASPSRASLPEDSTNG